MKKLLTFSLLFLVGFSFMNCSGSAEPQKKETQEPVKDTIEVSEDLDDETLKAIVFSWSTKKYSKEVCFDPDKEDDDPTDFCSLREVLLGKITVEDKSIETRINDHLLRVAIGNEKSTPSIAQWLIELNSIEERGEAFTETITCQKIGSGPNHVTISVSGDYYYYMGAHPTVLLTILNFNLTTGRPIQLSDLFKPGFGKALKKIAEKEFIRQNGSDGWDFTPGKGDFELAKQFYFNEKSLIFAYNQYEIGPYAAGMPEIIPIDRIKHLLNEDSYLLQLAMSNSK